MSLEKNSMIQVYLDTVSSHIKWREVHGQVKSELLSHLEDIVMELRNDGISEQQAVTEAIHRMGDADDLGRQLQQTHVPQKNWPLVAIVTLLSGVGIVLMYMLEMSGLFTPSVHVFTKSLIFTGFGVAILLWLYYCDFRKVRSYTTYLYIGTMLLWFMGLFLGTSINGKQFLAFGPISIDYSGIIPYVLVVSLAGILADRDWSNQQWVKKVLLLFIVTFLFCVMSNNTPLSFMYTLVFLVLMAIDGARKVQITGFLMVPLGYILIKMYQEVGSLNLAYYQSASLWGQSNLGVNAITAFHTDFSFLYFIQEYGWLAGLMLIFAGIALLLILVSATLQVKDRFGRMTVGGLTVCFAVQMTWHVLMSLGVMPVVSISMPFISFGGSQTVIHLGAIGVILSIYKRKNLMRARG
ncbi:cell division protein FtsW (lipid II flippase) [Sporomusaceae bacterium BoRhaA]|uniref:FtsW/RodA/SpoVE family cell cycle protein n=1 Tax=Pelorhabdus rhamnosifermentans TaxID=2772457 RepID=UPI001C06051B|nr:FtsW/RodA/SpoVE family cell cycle protein [Pelorhabdus rhamnosifermentans]MBU2703358.1 cell division protein FtsW (lipid II flippase) [Pelorhabdus rhamnosifermentans]